MKISNYPFILLLSLILFSCFVYATSTDGSSNSPPDEWWMHGGNISHNRYALSNAPANLSNTTVITQGFAYTIGTPPLIVGDLIYLLPNTGGSSKYYKLNASNISQFYENSTPTYSLAYSGGPTYYNGSLYHHTNTGAIYHVNASNLSQTISSATIADGIYYASPTVYNNFVYIGDGNAAPRFKEYNLTNLSQVSKTYTSSNRIYASSPFAGNYVYVSETGVLSQLNASNISQTISSVSCAANGVEYAFPASKDYVYKTCTVNSVNILQQFNATNVSIRVANFSNGSLGGYALGNGYLYFGSVNNVYQVNASNVSQLIANFTTYTNTHSSNPPLVNRNYLFISAGSVMYQLDANNISRLISNFTATASITSSATLAKGYLYFGAGTKLYQMGVASSYSSVDTSAPSVTLNSPANNYYNDTALPTLNFGCSATDSSSILNISLYLTNNLNASFSLNQISSTSGTSVSGNWNVSLTNGNYTWNCLATDELNNYGFASSNRSITINFTDGDGDGVSNSNDNLIGNSSSVSTSGFSSLNVTVNGTSANGTFSGVQEIAFYNSNSLIANFSFNFSSTTFNLENVTLIKGTNYVLVNFSGQVPAIYNKTLYIEDNNFETICLKDQEISSISEFSSGCDGSNEVNVTSCIGSSSTVNFGSVTCRDEGSTIALGNLRNSAVLGSPHSAASSSDEIEETFEDGKASYINEVQNPGRSLILKLMSNSGVKLVKKIYDHKETGLREFEIKTKDWITGQIEVKKYDSLPDRCQIDKEDYVVYRALDFDHDFDNKYVDETRIRLEVEKDWINKNNVREIEVVRCYPEYQELKTSYVSEDDTFGVYDVYSKGFSIFAVIGTLDESKVELSPRKEIPRWINFIIPFLLLIGLLVYLIMKFIGRSHGIREDWHFKNKWFDFEFKFKIKTPPHKRKFLHDY